MTTPNEQSLMPMNRESRRVLSALVANLGSAKLCVHCLQSVLRQAKEDGLDWQGIYEEAVKGHEDRPVPSLQEVSPDNEQQAH